MYRVSSIKSRVIVIGTVLVVILSVLVGFFWFFPKKMENQTAMSHRQTQTVKTSSKALKSTSNQLTQERITDFLHAYYDRSSVGSNQKAYQPYVTSTLYQQLVENDHLQVQQQQGYLINRKMTTAKIYIDAKDNEAYCLVNYKFEQRLALPTSSKPKPSTTQVSSEQDIQLTFSKENKTWLVSSIQAVTIHDASMGDTTGQDSD